MVPQLRTVEDVSIVDWPPTGGLGVPALGGVLKQLLEAGGTARVLLNMAACEGMRADHLEALTEALTICRERDCVIGMYAVADRLARVIEVTGLNGDVPPVLGVGELDALAAIRGNGQPAAPEAGVLEFDLGHLATAPTAKFNLDTLSYAAEDVTKRFSPADQPPADLLAVFWGDLAATGYAIGGPDAEAVREAAQGPDAPRTQAGADSDFDMGVIDLDLGGAIGPSTEKLPVFEFDAGAPALELAAPPLPAPPPAVELEFSPVDTGAAGAPPPAVLQARAGAEAPGDADADDTIMFQPGALDAALLQAGLATPAAAPAAPQVPAPVAPPVPTPVAPPAAFSAPAAPGPPPAAPAPPAPAPPAPAPPADADADDTVMFQPGALDSALMAEVAAAAGPSAPIAVPEVEPPPQPPEPADDGEAAVQAFVVDHGLAPGLVEILDCFAKAGDEQVLARVDVQHATGGARGDVADAIEHLVQARLIRRTRSPRIRGGTGFLFSPSPRSRNTLGKLLGMWRDPSGRTKLSSWLVA